MVLGTVLDLVELRLDRGLFTLVLAHLAKDGIFLKGLDTMHGQGGRKTGLVGGGGRTSMSSFQGMSASGCGLVPLMATAWRLAGGAASSEALGRLRSSILTVSSDGGTTVLASSLIRAVEATLAGSDQGVPITSSIEGRQAGPAMKERQK